MNSHFRNFIFLCLLLLPLGQVLAQDLEPRRWTPLPPGINVVGSGIAVTTGDVLFDPALQIEDAKVNAETVVASYVRSFSLAGKLARFDLTVPWQHAKWTGLLQGQSASVTRAGFSDPVVRLSMILAGASPDPTASSNTVVGAAIAVTVPVGEYFEDKLLNLGQNRFVIRPQVGMVHTRGQWSYELTSSVFFFTDNDEFYGDSTREQNPLYAVQGHVIHSFKKPGYWAAMSAGYGIDGKSSINGTTANDSRRVFVSALSLGMPLGSRQGLKFAYVRDRTNISRGSDTDSFVIAWSARY
jgi:hypothetical protein